jgi:hypothetical protein
MRIRRPERSVAESKGLQFRNVRFLGSLRFLRHSLRSQDRQLGMTVTGKSLSSGVELQRRVAAHHVVTEA